MTIDIRAAVLHGVEAKPVDICIVLDRQPVLHIEGDIAPQAAKEMQVRIRSALTAFDRPRIGARVTIDASQVCGAQRSCRELRGGRAAALDLPIALGILQAQGAYRVTERYLAVGELSLDGKLRQVRGAVSFALEAKRRGVRLILPADSKHEGRMVAGVDLEFCPSLLEAAASTAVPGYRKDRVEEPVWPTEHIDGCGYPDFSDIRGQDAVVAQVKAAVAAKQNILLIGPPGAGKTMIARRIPGILPALTDDELLEIARINSAAGLLQQGRQIVRPFRAPHHTCSVLGLTGGGIDNRPGEVTLAHRGVLFLDELPEFSRGALDAVAWVVRDGQAAPGLPANVLLVGAMNPCACGWHGTKKCQCSAAEVARYRGRVARYMPLFEAHIEVPPVPLEALL